MEDARTSLELISTVFLWRSGPRQARCVVRLTTRIDHSCAQPSARGARFFRLSMVVLLNLRLTCSLFAPKPGLAHFRSWWRSPFSRSGSHTFKLPVSTVFDFATSPRNAQRESSGEAALSCTIYVFQSCCASGGLLLDKGNSNMLLFIITYCYIAIFSSWRK